MNLNRFTLTLLTHTSILPFKSEKSIINREPKLLLKSIDSQPDFRFDLTEGNEEILFRYHYNPVKITFKLTPFHMDTI